MSNANPVKVIVLCTDVSGMPTFHMCTVNVTKDQYDNGDHYDLAKEDAEENGYEEPMMAFDTQDYASRQFAELQAWVE